MTPRDERHLNRLTYAALIGVLLAAVLGHLMPEPVPDVQMEPVTAERGHDWKAAHERISRLYSTCHVSLVRAQDRLRRLGHRWSEEAHGWVRVR